MFDIEERIPSLILCKKLRKLGYLQEGGGFYWWRDRKDKQWKLYIFNNSKPGGVSSIKAPTSGELIDALPVGISYIVNVNGENIRVGGSLIIHKLSGKYKVFYDNTDKSIEDLSLANALAKMFILLANCKYVEIK